MQVVHSNFGPRVLQIAEQKSVVHNRTLLQLVFALRHNGLPVRSLGMTGINRNQLASRRLQIGLYPEHRPVVIHEEILRIEIVQQFHDGRIWLRQIFVVQPVLRRRPLRYMNNQVPAIVGDRSPKQQLLVIGTLVDQLVFRLRCPQLVVIEFLKIIRVPQRGSFGLVIPAIEESLVILTPRRAGKL